MNNEFGLSELYDVFIKATYPIEAGGKTFEPGETLCVFDKIQVANFQEVQSVTSARGGFSNAAHIYWETTREVDLVFSQGIFNSLQFALLCNAKLIQNDGSAHLSVSKREEVESNEDGIFTLSEMPNGKVFLYEKETGNNLTHYLIEGKEIVIGSPFKSIIADYTFNYDGGAQQLILGKALVSGFLELEGKTRVKDDISGKTRTGIIKIPKLKLMSDLSMRLGKNANPVVANLRAKAIPSGDRQNTTVMDLFFLNDDIDSDM